MSLPAHQRVVLSSKNEVLKDYEQKFVTAAIDRWGRIPLETTRVPPVFRKDCGGNWQHEYHFYAD
jgi:hypothetical protein